MAEFTVIVRVLTANGNVLEIERTTQIPPDYQPRDTAHLYAHKIEEAAHDLIEAQGNSDWVPTFKRAALLNDARLRILERLAAQWRQETGPRRADGDAVLEVLNRPEALLEAEIEPSIEE